MEARELRLGNLLDVDGIVYKVVQIANDGVIVEPITEYGHLIDYERKGEMKPIQLNEYWLDLLGLELVIEDGLRFWKITANGRTFKSLESILFTWEKYVHNLQNAVFASLQYELEMKNPA